MSGPAKPDTEYPSASRLKFLGRSAGSPSAPVAFWVATWNSMNETPISDVAANSAGRPGKIRGSAAPTAMPKEPARIGPRTAMRSDIRPAPTASHIGRNEYRPINVPTTNGDAPSDNASREHVTRLPVGAV